MTPEETGVDNQNRFDSRYNSKVLNDQMQSNFNKGMGKERYSIISVTNKKKTVTKADDRFYNLIICVDYFTPCINFLITGDKNKIKIPASAGTIVNIKKKNDNEYCSVIFSI